MDNFLGARYVVSLLTAIGLVLHAASASAVPILSIAPPSTVVGVDQTFSVDVVISDVTDLFAFQFDLGFDPTVLSATSLSEGPFLASGGPTLFIPGTIDNTTGLVSFTLDTLLGSGVGVTGSGPLVSLAFNALTPGTSPLTFSNVLLFGSQSAAISARTENGTVSVVPEPATLLLMGVGLVGAAVLRRSRG